MRYDNFVCIVQNNYLGLKNALTGLLPRIADERLNRFAQEFINFLNHPQCQKAILDDLKWHGSFNVFGRFELLMKLRSAAVASFSSPIKEGILGFLAPLFFSETACSIMFWKDLKPTAFQPAITNLREHIMPILLPSFLSEEGFQVLQLFYNFTKGIAPAVQSFDTLEDVRTCYIWDTLHHHGMMGKIAPIFDQFVTPFFSLMEAPPLRETALLVNKMVETAIASTASI